MVNPNTAADQKSYSTPNAKTAIEVKADDLPIDRMHKSRHQQTRHAATKEDNKRVLCSVPQHLRGCS